MPMTEKIKCPECWLLCCKIAWKTKKYQARKDFADHVCYSFCPECGNQIRPTKKCCILATFRGHKHCTECGDNVFKFFVLETQEVKDA